MEKFCFKFLPQASHVPRNVLSSSILFHYYDHFIMISAHIPFIHKDFPWLPYGEDEVLLFEMSNSSQVKLQVRRTFTLPQNFHAIHYLFSLSLEFIFKLRTNCTYSLPKIIPDVCLVFKCSFRSNQPSNHQHHNLFTIPQHEPSATSEMRLTLTTKKAAIDDVSQASAPQGPIEDELEGDFFRFPKLPTSVRDRIWKHSIPSGRVVDVVFDENQDKYFSFHAIVPAILHTSKEARSVGLRFYTFCFGTESHHASIPFDFKADCLLFDDWLAPRTKAKNDPQPTCASELARVIGPMGGLELQSVHRIALSVEFFSSFSRKQFVEGLQLLFARFPATDFLVFVMEPRDPYNSEPVSFWDVEEYFCCDEHCLSRTEARIFFAVEQVLALAGDNIIDMELESQRIKLRLRGATRGDEEYGASELWECVDTRSDEDKKEEYLKRYWDEIEDDDEQTRKRFRYQPQQDVSEEVPEEFEVEELEEGELEELLMDGLRDISWRDKTRGNSRWGGVQE